MPIRISDIKLKPQDADNPQKLESQLKKHYGIKADQIKHMTVRKKSLDARSKRNIHYLFQLDIELHDEEGFRALHPSVAWVPHPRELHPLDGLDTKPLAPRHAPIVVGSGPSGIFAAYVLSLAGLKPIIIERGEKVEARMRTVNQLRRAGEFNEESNYCFGEGGAGTFSDGKLTCGRNHPLIQFIFQQFVKFGAPESILYDAHPHIGTDNLLKICIQMRSFLEARGCQFLFNTRVDEVKTHSNLEAKISVKLSTGETLLSDHVVLAIGHSARDTYQKLYDEGLAMEAKPFAIGARFEHEQSIINGMQYGASCPIGSLPAAEYKLAAQTGDRGIWTFCMCPGGFLMPTGAQAGHLAINGMSYYSRASGYANAAIVVNVRREDYFQGHPLDGMRWQQALEQKVFQSAGSNYYAPAQRIEDFINGAASKGEIKSSYEPGTTNSRLDLLLPEFVTNALRAGVVDFNKKMHGFISKGGNVVGLESKTSSPIVMLRGKDFASLSHPGLFPAGEGAGFAGGIVSASLDGVRVAQGVLQSMLAG